MKAFYFLILFLSRIKYLYRFLSLLTGLVLSLTTAHAQLSGSDSLQAKLTDVFGQLDKSQIPTGYLFEVAP